MLRITSRQALDQDACVVVRWQHPQLRIYAIRSRGLVFEAAPLAPRGALTPPLIGHQLTCVLRGELVSRRDGPERSARPGFALVEPSMTWNERWMGAAFDALLIDWDPRLLPIANTESLPLGPAGTERVEALFQHILSSGDDEDSARRIVARAEDLLAHLGLGSFDPSAAPDWFEGTEASRTAARWVSQLRGDMHTASLKRAMALTGLGERQLRRQYADLAERAGLPTQLRAVLVNDRIIAAVRLLSLTAPIGEVAKAAGFGSSRALGLALDHASLPTATELRRLARHG